MSVNESKSDLSNPVSWAKWRKSGAVGAMLDAETLPIRKTAKPIVAMGTSFNPDGTPSQTTLSIGEKVIAKGPGWTASKPEAYAVVPGNPFRFEDRVRTKDLPPGTKTLSQAYPKTESKGSRSRGNW